MTLYKFYIGCFLLGSGSGLLATGVAEMFGYMVYGWALYIMITESPNWRK